MNGKWVADLLDNKIAVSQQFAIDWGLNYNTPENSISNGMAIAAAIKGGSVVVVPSVTGIKPVPGIGPYGVSKAAVAHMARIAAVEGAKKGIRVNAIAPGGVDTAIWEGGEDFAASVAAIGREATIKAMAKTTPLGRFATSEEMADNILYLLSDAASNITGHVMVSDGGFTL